MKEQNIEKIKNACVAANPEIIPRKIVPGTRLKHYEGWECVAVGFPDEHNGIMIDNGYAPIKCFEILGRSIRLCDVLLAVKTKIESGKSVFVPSAAGDRGTPLRNMLEWIWENWNLLKDDLRLQEEETLSFIAGLLSE